MTFKRVLSLTVSFAIAAAVLTSCGEADKRPEFAYDPEAPSLYEAYEDYFKVGTAINSWQLKEGTNEFEIITKQFNEFVMENETKPDQIHPKENEYRFAGTDAFVEFGEKYGKTLRGHTLVWHSQCPDWFFEGENGEDASADLLVQRMKDHITTVVSRYKGKIYSWDVVNEVIDDAGGMRFSNWLKIVKDYDGDGDRYDFVEIAFRTAREADPDARLILNDYGLESNEDKAISAYMMVKKMMEEGVPIDGIGLQMHIGYDFDVEKCKENVKILAKLKEINPDFVLEVTELDMTCFAGGDDSTEMELTSKFVKEFDKKYAEVFTMFKELAEEGLLDSVVFWGYYDGGTWLNGFPVEGRTNHPLLIDRDYRFKSAYWAVMDAAR